MFLLVVGCIRVSDMCVTVFRRGPGWVVGHCTYSSTRAKRWTALINGVSVLGGRAFPSRDKAAIQVLLEHEHRQDRAARDGRRQGYGLTSIGASVPP
jgi:hypothetical protein